jgi:chromosome segregation ATPase
MPARKRPSKSSRTPLDDRQRKLLEEQEKLQQRMEELSRMIEDAPRIKAEKVKARRDELMTDRRSRSEFRLNSATLMDTRYADFGGKSSGARRRPLKAERRQSLLIFLGWLLLLAVLLIFLLSVWHWQWPGSQ